MIFYSFTIRIFFWYMYITYNEIYRKSGSEKCDVVITQLISHHEVNVSVLVAEPTMRHLLYV